MKLQSKQQKQTKIILIAVAALLAVALIVGIVFLVSSIVKDGEDKKENTKIQISTFPKIEYYVGEKFDATGLKIQVLTGNNDTSYIVSYPDSNLKISGFDSSQPGEVIMSVTYKECSTTLKVTIKEYPAASTTVLESIRLSDNMSYSLRLWKLYGPNFDKFQLILTYSDGSEVEIPMSSNYCSGIDRSITEAGTTQFTITYSDGATTVSTTVTVTITE